MLVMSQLVECVPNFSEGRNQEVRPRGAGQASRAHGTASVAEAQAVEEAAGLVWGSSSQDGRSRCPWVPRTSRDWGRLGSA